MGVFTHGPKFAPGKLICIASTITPAPVLSQLMGHLLLGMPKQPTPQTQMLRACRAGPSGEDMPPIFIDRAGAKIGLVEQHSRNSKASLSLVLEQACLPAL